MQEKIQSILDDYQADLYRATEMASLRFNALVKATLDGWAERYTRHTFKAMEGHGMMSLYVSPPICARDHFQGETPLELEDAKNHRGAVAELVAEACALVAMFNESERRVGLMCDDYVTPKA